MNRGRGRRRKPSLFLWHRWLGLGAAFWLVVLSLTGLMLNHTESLKLDERRVEARWLSRAYGISPPPLVKAYRVQDHWISQWGDELFFDGEPLGVRGRLRGAAAAAGMVVAGAEGELILLGPQGQLVERTPMPGLRQVGKAEGALLVRVAGGLRRADAEVIEWSPVAGETAVVWSRAVPLPRAIRTAIEQRLLGAGLPLERVVLDLHSGRIFGAAGVFLMDAAAVVLLFSTFSGVWLWLRHRRRRRRSARSGCK